MFSPVIEPQHQEAFFSNYSDKLLREGAFHKVPLLLGVNSNEAAAVGDITGKFLVRSLYYCLSIYLLYL